MHRNLDRRVESLVKVERAPHKASLQEILDLSLSSETGSWHQIGDKWIRMTNDANGKKLDDLQNLYIKRFAKGR
jgi:polyphosphate kinase